MATFPDYSGREYLSASTHNAWRDALLEFFSRASAQVLPFSAYNDSTASAGDEDEYVYSGTTTIAWQGYFIYTGLTDDLYYDITNNNTNGTTQVVVDDTNIMATETASGNRTGTIDLSSLNLSAGSTYGLKVQGIDNGGGAAVRINWVGMQHDPTYTAPPTISTGISASQLSDMYDGLTEINTLMDLPVSTFPYEEVSRTVVNDNDYIVWNGEIYHTHDTIAYRIYNPEAKAEFTIHINGSEVLAVQNSGDDYYEGTVDISAESLTIGTKYNMQVKQNRFDSGVSELLTTGVQWLAQVSDLTPVAVTDWTQGDVVSSATPHNWIRDMINRVHPGSSSKDVPLLYRDPATKIPSAGKFFGRRLKPYLRYVYDGLGTPSITYGGTNFTDSTQDLSSGSGIQTYDFKNLLELSPGQYYSVDDVDHVQESDFA